MRRFTTADDVELTRFGDSVAAPPVTFSPDGRYFVVTSERGRLDINRPESSLRVYRTEDVRSFLPQSSAKDEPSPFWVVNKSTYRDGPIITDVRWLADSTGIAFLVKTGSGNNQLFLGDMRRKDLQGLTEEDRNVTAFDVRSRGRFAYTLSSRTLRNGGFEERDAPQFVGTGRALSSIIFPEESTGESIWVHDLSELWVVIDGVRLPMMDRSSGRPLPIHLLGESALALSPDGRSVATALTVRSIPHEWEALYPPPLPSSPYRIRAGAQNPESTNGQRDVSEYVVIDVVTGKIKGLAHAPIGTSAAWWGAIHADWASDGQSLVLSDTFLPPNPKHISAQSNRPCVVVADVVTDHVTCIERLEGESSSTDGRGWRYIYGSHFVPGSNRRVIVEYSEGVNALGSTTFDRGADGAWVVVPKTNKSAVAAERIEVAIKQDLNNAPVVVASDDKNKLSRRIWNPNPQLDEIEMGDVVRFRWTDKYGRAWVGGLYKPPEYVPGKRYPLVIQTHGFVDREFSPSGAFTTAFAAQELAANGFLVLQINDCPVRNTPEEGSCQVAGYEAAVEHLAADGLVDSDRVGIIGFSRTCYYVLDALTTSSLQFRAAAIIDGINVGYLQYMLDIDTDSNNSIAREANAIIGAAPFGVGLEQWLKRSPEFKMERVRTPLQVMATKRSILQMWEPYATLRYLGKPVDLLVLNSDEHVFTNPAERVASQVSTIDWFCFWLKDKEDTDPSKLAQYERWRRLRALHM
jgi:dienelactone hydrolase